MSRRAHSWNFASAASTPADFRLKVMSRACISGVMNPITSSGPSASLSNFTSG